ncbi:TPA: hypothetical protein OXB57_004915 [Escherichia coli]|nr:hypothetical protein [Escherichia coli]
MNKQIVELVRLNGRGTVIASELDVGDERTEMFEIYSVLRNLCRRGYATQVGRMTNPLLSSCDEDDSDEDDE